MKKLFFILLSLQSFYLFGQHLEEAIYVAAETFIAAPNNASLKLLQQKELDFKHQVNTKDEQLALVFLQCHKGYFLDQQSQLKQAIITYEDALKRFEYNGLSKISDFDIVESCLIPLGNLYTKTNNFTSAETIITQYIVIAENHQNHKQKISGIINLAQLYYTIHEFETAINLTSKYLDNPNNHPDQKTKLIAINSESKIALGYSINSNLISNENTYKISLQNGDYNKALKAFQKVKLKQFSNKNAPKRYLAKLLVEEAELYMLLNTPTKVSQCLNEALLLLIEHLKPNTIPNTEALYAENTFIDIFDLYAEIQTDVYNALKFYNLSFYVADLLRNTWTSQEAKILNQTKHKTRSEKCIDLLYHAYQNTKDKQYILKAFQYSEQSKASTLKEIFQKKLRLEKHPNDSLLLKEYSLLKQQEHFTGLLIRERLGKNNVSSITNFNKKLTEISLQLKTIKHKISQTFLEERHGISLEVIQRKLHKDKGALVEYFYGKHTIYQFIITSKNILMHHIDLTSKAEAKVIAFIHLFDNAALINDNIPKFSKNAFSVFKLLKFNAVSNYKNIIIVPDGPLSFIPFEALLTQHTQTLSFSNMPFVIKDQTIVYNSSAFLYTLNTTAIKDKNVIGFFPVFSNSNRALNYSIEEANAIKGKMNSKILMHHEASKQNFKKLAKNYGILHLSSHASGGNSIVPASIDFYDSTLLLNELYSMNLNSRLVVLSACETGIGKMRKGEGAMSIARGFQYAGVQNILFSLWKINDKSTSQIIASFYKSFSKNKSFYRANHKSKIDYLKNKTISNYRKSPYYWSAFVYYGSLEAKKTNNNSFFIVFSIIFLIILLVIVVKTKTHVYRKPTNISS